MTTSANSIVFAALVSMVAACSTPAPPVLSAKVKPAMDSLVFSMEGFSGVVMVADQGQPVYHNAFGYRDFRTLAPMDTAAVFELASVSKTFTAAAVLRLVQDGKIGLEDTVTHFITGLPYEGITIRHLLNHTSGLPDYQAVMDQYWDKSKVAGNADCIEYLIQYKPDPLFSPGERYAYSNTGYLLLASIAEQVSGTEFTEYIREMITQPLRMDKTQFRTLQEKVAMPDFAWGFIPDEGGVQISADSFPSSNYTIWLGNRKGPGRISSTASDLLKWDRSWYTGRILNEKLITAAYQPARLLSDSLTAYGFGWELREMNGRQMVGHSGNNPGYRTLLVRDIEANRTVILLSNNSFESLDNLAAGLFSVLEKEAERFKRQW